jgi:ketosteroid isomerase-like protein
MAAEDDVRKASQKFYQALNKMVSGDSKPMIEIWSHSPTVTTLHPIGGREVGWDAVKNSFDQVAGLASGGNVQIKDQMIRVVGDMAYEVGIEAGQTTLAGQKVNLEHRVTNIYQREGGQWKMIHHHGDVAPAMVEIVERLQVENARR